MMALLLTFVLTPAVRLLRRHGIREAVGAALLVSALLGSSIPVVALLAEPAAQWWDRAPSTVAAVLARIDRWRADLPVLGPASGTRRNASAEGSDPVKARLASEGIALTGSLLGESARFTLSAVATVILLYLLLASEHWMLARCIEVLPPRPRLRALVLAGLRAAQRDIGRYLMALALVNLGVGLVTTLAMAWLGLPSPGLWGMVAALLNFMPYIGPVLTMTALALAATMAGATGLEALMPPLAYLAIHAFESNIVSPWFIGRRLAMNPLSVFLSVLVWGWLWGVAGAVIAVPLLIGLRSLSRRNRKLHVMALYLEGSARPALSLGSLLRCGRTQP
ncbi:AI-2E family transporter [Pelomonas sp. CA6]|nr:AI-2E family transporter [Pelomonas sp. CA6]